MNKMLSFAKAALLCFTLAVLAVGFVPAAADAAAAPGDITVICDGGRELCVTYENPSVIIDFYFGNPLVVIIEM